MKFISTEEVKSYGLAMIFFIDTIITCRSLEILVETVVYDVADPGKTDEDVFNDNKNSSRRMYHDY